MTLPRENNNKELISYHVSKISWKGKYKRILSIGTSGISTYNPSNLVSTNHWSYADIVSIYPVHSNSLEFQLAVRKGGKKVDSVKFSSEYRADIVTEALKQRHHFNEKSQPLNVYNAYKIHWSDTKIPCVLEVSPHALERKDASTLQVMASYYFRDVETVRNISDNPNCFAIVMKGTGRMYMFSSERKGDILSKLVDQAEICVGVTIKIAAESITTQVFRMNRFGSFSKDEHVTSMVEFIVQKITPNHCEPVRRLLCVSETCIVERDPSTYFVCTLRPLNAIFALVRPEDNPQEFCIEYSDGETRKYSTTEREALLATLLDGVRASGNRDVHVRMTPVDRGKRIGPLKSHVDEEIESYHLRFLAQPPPGMSFAEAISRFNACVSYSGLVHAVTQESFFAENKEKLINSALAAIVSKEVEVDSLNVEVLAGQFQALRRLVASKAGFGAFTTLAGFREKLGSRVVRALKRNSEGVAHVALDTLCALMVPMHEDGDLRQEQLNKASLLSTKKFLDSLLDMWCQHVVKGSGALVVVAMLDFLNFALCPPYSETTDEKHFDTLLEMVADRGKTIFRLFQHPSLAIVKGAGLLMKSVIEEGEVGIAGHMQDLALSEAAFPRHLHVALYTQIGNRTDRRMLTVRQLSRYLVGLWTTGHDSAYAVFGQMMPAGLLDFLRSKESVPEDADLINTRDSEEFKRNIVKNQRNAHVEAIEKQLMIAEKYVEKQVEIAVEFALQHWREGMGIEKRDSKIKERPVVLRKRRERLKPEANWSMFYYEFSRDHTKSNLIWNNKTREELREALENELRSFDQDRNMGILSQDMETSGHVNVSWNFNEFEVSYPSLADEIKIGDYYLRVLLEKGDVDGNLLCQGGTPDSPEKKSGNRKAFEFFNDLYHRFLLSSKPSMKCLCLQAMTVVYGRYCNEIGPFHDTKYILAMLDKCTDLAERDRLLQFVSKLVQVRANAKELMDAHGIRILVDLLTLAHLHKNRAIIHTQTNVIEAGPNMKQHAYKEWHCRVSEEQQGPFSYDELCDMFSQKVINPNTRVWAQGMDGWKPIHSVAQIKWRLVGSGTAVLNESDIASLVLDILIKICRYSPSRDNDGAVIRPLPRVKRLLTEPGSLPHIVQLLLTFDPILVEKTAILLTEIVHDNPVLPRMYLTGVFFFLLMYTGSNILPIARFLQLTNARQAFRSEAVHSKELLQRSILGPILPEAMVCYLENHGAEKFSEIFLGEFDTPEAIWNSEMRRMMIERIASHISDFSPRLSSNTRALYQYCPIPAVTYPQLEAELFCNVFYLRHLCNVSRFPDWPIKEPVQLLKDVLETWKDEVEKKPPSMSIEDAYKILKLPLPTENQTLEESSIRKAYFKLAQIYHPDKNPEGRDMFEKVNKAYEFLCSRKARMVSGPDPKNIVLILQTQSILFGRYCQELEPYKYSGYPMLVRTIELETRDDTLFSKTYGLLSAAAEVAYHTVKCSALNAEELRREGGLEALLEAFSRCSSVLSKSSKQEDVAVLVSSNVLLCFTVAARFQSCRERIAQMTTVIGEICRILYFKHLTKLCIVTAKSISALSADSDLQLQLVQHGALWHLLLFLFQYDYTMDEGGVERSESSNQQEASNKLAREAIHACARLGGYLENEDASPSNMLVRGAMSALLTPYVTKLFGTISNAEVLKILNSNTRDPHLIWDNSTRLELLDYLTEQQQKQIKGGLAAVDPSFGAQFVYSSHKKELIVGDIFVRVYNEQPSFVIQDPKLLAQNLLSFIGSEVQFLHSAQGLPVQNSTTKAEELESVLEALGNLLKVNPGEESTCIGHFRLLFSLLLLHHRPEIISKTLLIVILTSGNRNCIEDLTQSEVLGYLLLLLVDSPQHLNLALESLFGLMVNTGLVKEAFAKGCLIYLLEIFCNSSSSESSSQAKTQAAETLSRIMADRLVGPRIRTVLGKFLPRAIVDAFTESHTHAQMLFDSETQNPELIWNADSRKVVCVSVKKLSHAFADVQRVNLTAIWNPPDSESAPVYCSANDEIIVGGVFLRLFVANPGWVLRKPREFMAELLDTTLEHMSKDHVNSEHLETLVTAFSGLLRSQPLLSDQLPSMGYLPRILKSMKSSQSVSRFGITIVHQLAMSQACVESLSRLECVQPLQSVLSRRPELSQLTCDTLSRLFSSGVEDLVDQALKCDLITALLNILDTSLIRTPQEAEGITAAARANAVAALKAMTRSPFYGERVNALLLKSDVWVQYKDQRHDLFLNNTHTSGYLTGSTGIAGSLTYQTYAAASHIPPQEKPPLWEY